MKRFLVVLGIFVLGNVYWLSWAEEVGDLPADWRSYQRTTSARTCQLIGGIAAENWYDAEARCDDVSGKAGYNDHQTQRGIVRNGYLIFSCEGCWED